MKYSIGVDFGTESGRAVLISVENGEELASSIYNYQNGVIDRRLPLENEEVALGQDWALQDPEDYLRTFKNTIPEVIHKAGVDPKDIIGVGIDFTACTMLPVTKDGTPLCVLPQYRKNPHAWVRRPVRTMVRHARSLPELSRRSCTRWRVHPAAACRRWNGRCCTPTSSIARFR